MFCKKVVLRNFIKFTGKHLCLRPATLLKKRLWCSCFPVKFVKFLRTSFLTEHLQWLLLTVPDFVTVPQLCTIHNTSNSMAKARIRTPFFLKKKKGKTETIFHTSYELNTLEIVNASKLKSFSFMILKKLLESIFQFFQYKVQITTLCFLFTFMFTH